MELLPNQCLRNLQWTLLKVSCKGKDPERVALVNQEADVEARKGTQLWLDCGDDDDDDDVRISFSFRLNECSRCFPSPPCH